ncbi:phage/plasmid replication protein, II/X family [Massilia norwichensis]|uniref:Phage/plasmid replication protein, II/X family n=1 Tax=Massilia norwichensis TaxID=1442366 RepID=A0ABT2A8C3_9BURK|nr:phage/plasmid replication protein, II/X family [Massilia norwichensis]MCS0590424.1 phage/plasmid replication protein, II/X family [Massilia norwichensis]
MNTKRDHLAGCLMIDTMGLRVENVPNLKLPKAFARVSDDPHTVDDYGWAKGNLRSESGKHMSMRVRTIKASSQLLVEGSNSMQYLDHNIVSSGDAVMTAFSMLDAVRRQHRLHLDSVFRPREFMQGRDIETTRIDVAVPLRIPGDLRLGAVINALAFAGLRANVATSIYPNESVYFDQHSQLETLKAYDKAVEMKQSRRALELPSTQNAVDLMSFASSTLRFEGVFRLKQLKRLFGNTPVMPSMLPPHVMAEMFSRLLSKYELHGGLRRLLSQADLWKIRSPYRTTVALWQAGTDVRSIFNGNEGLLRSHHRVIKRDYGINVLAPSPVTLNHHVELGEILRIENFVPVPAAIRADPALFYQRDMVEEFKAHCRANGFHGISAMYVDPYENTSNLLASTH